MNVLRRQWLNIMILSSTFAMFSCSNAKPPSEAATIDHAGAKQIGLEEMKKKTFVTRHVVYVPVYSHIYHQDKLKFDLTATLSIRNTDLHNSIILKSAKYFNTEGKVVREYINSPLELRSMATLDFVVGQQDRSGGSGANFIVEWVSEKQVSDPIIECVMIGTSGQQGVSFLSNGKVIE